MLTKPDEASDPQSAVAIFRQASGVSPVYSMVKVRQAFRSEPPPKFISPPNGFNPFLAETS